MDSIPDPTDVIAAVVHPNPYPYYAALVADSPMYYDPTQRRWIALGAAVVRSVLHSQDCRVRPADEPVPRSLLGSGAGAIFGALIRMNDGHAHCPFKRVVATALDAFADQPVLAQSRQWAPLLFGAPARQSPHSAISAYAFHLPVYVVASLLGVAPAMVPQVACWMQDLVPCFGPASSVDQITCGKAAADHLLGLFQGLMKDASFRRNPSLLGTLDHEARQLGHSDSAMVIANGIGLMAQAYEATAGLIGNTLVAFADQPALYEQVTDDPGLLPLIIQEVLRYDSPIQNTRRFVAHNAVVAGHAMQAGDPILVVLAAANRDPAANSDPQRFELGRQNRQIFSFGAGSHACPGEALAMTIARVGVQHILESGFDPRRLPRPSSYRASANTRIPLWDMGTNQFQAIGQRSTEDAQ